MPLSPEREERPVLSQEEAHLTSYSSINHFWEWLILRKILSLIRKKNHGLAPRFNWQSQHCSTLVHFLKRVLFSRAVDICCLCLPKIRFLFFWNGALNLYWENYSITIGYNLGTINQDVPISPGQKMNMWPKLYQSDVFLSLEFEAHVECGERWKKQLELIHPIWLWLSIRFHFPHRYFGYFSKTDSEVV